MIAVRRHHAQPHAAANRLDTARDRREMRIEHDEWRAGGERRADRGFTPEFAAEQARQLIGAVSGQNRIRELQDFPCAVGPCTAAALAPVSTRRSDADASAPP